MPVASRHKVRPVPDHRVVEAMYSRPEGFVSSCQILREDQSIGFLEPTPSQLLCLQAKAAHPWLMVNKYRQSKTSTPATLWMLGESMFNRGIKCALVADKHDTAEELFHRANFAWENLPNYAKVHRVKSSRQYMEFEHSGYIQTLTARTDTPGCGLSIDRLVVSEFCNWPCQEVAAAELFPAISKRPNAKVWMESTPGKKGSPHELLWRQAWAGKGRFTKALFLKWWLDPTCAVAPPPDFRLDTSEQRFIDKHPFVSIGHMQFRRLALETEFFGDELSFENKYPMGPYSGWKGASHPVFPQDEIIALLDKAIKEPRDGRFGCREVNPPKGNGVYMITADPAGHGLTGDPSALTVWDGRTWEEMAVWDGREDPGRFAARLRRVQERYNGAMLVVESNASACVAHLKAQGTRNLFYTNPRHPGWYATNKSLMAAEARTVEALRSGDMKIHTKATLQQLLDYDGSRKHMRPKGTQSRHHFDRARTVVMAADVLALRFHVAPEIITGPESVVTTYLDPEWTADMFDRKRRLLASQANSPFFPLPRS